jgi:hypothetical protein
MQAHFTQRLADALLAGFNRCTENARPLTSEQEADILAAVFGSFADEILEGVLGRG